MKSNIFVTVLFHLLKSAVQYQQYCPQHTRDFGCNDHFLTQNWKTVILGVIVDENTWLSYIPILVIGENFNVLPSTTTSKLIAYSPLGSTTAPVSSLYVLSCPSFSRLPNHMDILELSMWSAHLKLLHLIALDTSYTPSSSLLHLIHHALELLRRVS